MVLHPDLITFLPTAKDVEEIASLVQLYSSKNRFTTTSLYPESQFIQTEDFGGAFKTFF